MSASFLEPGFHKDCPAHLYHSDPCERPSLSSSIAKVIVEETPLKAWLAHPRLNLGYQEEADSKFDLGSAVHDWLSSGGGRIRVLVGFDDFKTKAAQTARDEARAEGMIPLLVKHSEQAGRIVEQVLDVLDRRKINLGSQESVFVANDHGALVRAMMDGFDPPNIWDFKITGCNLASDNAVGRHLVDMQYDLRAAFYVRVAELVFPALAGRLKYSWIMVEKDPPHGVRIVECDGTFKEMGGRKYRHALGLWKQCVDSEHWPHLERMGRTVPYPSFAESQWLERETSDGFVMGPQEMLKRMDNGIR